FALRGLLLLTHLFRAFSSRDRLDGLCSAQLTVVPSHRGCSSDKDCPGGLKCCRFDCGPVCVPPVFSEFQLIMDAKGPKTQHKHE
uniref:WAP domain-containing protein n=1 Tax=Sinocyclocheilus anshuiensis TaxID=1608454 RepID=A0A671LTR0_9TELE